MLRRRGCCPSRKVEEGSAKQHQIEDYLDYERQKEPLGDFTLSEYNEKGETSDTSLLKRLAPSQGSNVNQRVLLRSYTT